MILQSLEEKGVSVLNGWKNRQKLREEERRKVQTDEEFFKQIAETKQNLQIARSNFNIASDESLVEYYIYRMKAEETKLNYYLALAKKEQRRASASLVQKNCTASGGGCI